MIRNTLTKELIVCMRNYYIYSIFHHCFRFERHIYLYTLYSSCMSISIHKNLGWETCPPAFQTFCDHRATELQLPLLKELYPSVPFCYIIWKKKLYGKVTDLLLLLERSMSYTYVRAKEDNKTEGTAITIYSTFLTTEQCSDSKSALSHFYFLSGILVLFLQHYVWLWFYDCDII